MRPNNAHTVKMVIDGRVLVATYKIGRFETRPGTFTRMVEEVVIHDLYGRSVPLTKEEMDQAWHLCETNFLSR